MANAQPELEPARDPFGFDDEAPGRSPSMPSPLDWLQLVVGSIRRRWVLASSVFLLLLAASAAYYRLRAPSYRVEAKILAQPAPAISSLGRSDDLPSRSAWDLVHRRDNLVALAEQTGLSQGETAEAGHGIVSRLLEMLRPPEIQRKEEPIDAIVRALDKRLVVSAEGGAIEIRVDWPNAQHAYQIVQGAVQSFLEARHVQEVTSIDDVIAQMEGRTATLKTELDEAMAAARRRPPAAPRIAAPRQRQPSEELVRLRSLLDAKTRAARDVEEFRGRRLAELESQLTQARATLSEVHPTIQSLRRDIEALSHESPQLRALREEERKVRGEYAARWAREGYPANAAVTGEAPVIVEPGVEREEDPRVRDLRLQHEQMTARVTAARVDLDAARAAFKYRYNVVWPPEIPTEPYSPNPLKVFGAGLLSAILLALLAAVLPDLLTRRIVERWQVERQLNLTVLGEIPPSTQSKG